MWAVPRSVSTAFERMMMQRGDFKIFHEPFSEYYYFSKDRVNNRYKDVKPHEDHNYDAIANKIIESSHQSPVFIKDMAYHVKECMDKDFMNTFVHTFIIREPKTTLLSQLKMLPDTSYDETGYEQQYRLFEMQVRRTGRIPVVIDADDLCNYPDKIVSAYCDEVGINFINNSLKWDVGLPKEWKTWERWHLDAANSTGFKPLTNKTKEYDYLLDNSRIQDLIDYCQKFYDEMYKYRIRIKSQSGQKMESEL